MNQSEVGGGDILLLQVTYVGPLAGGGGGQGGSAKHSSSEAF